MGNDLFCIYGAGIVAMGVYKAIEILYRKKPVFFLVSDAQEGKKDENPVQIDGIPVLRISKWKQMPERKLQGRYLIAVPQPYHDDIEKKMIECGVAVELLFFVTSKVENKLLEAYFSHILPGRTVQSMLNADKCIVKSECSVTVYQAKSHVDKLLKLRYEMPKYVVPIQVGTVFAEHKISNVQDDMGDNISAKNRNYCELTASYFAWRNCDTEYKGICHYRRIFDITDVQMEDLLSKEEEWDVILPYPSICYPDFSAQHKRYINDYDWKALIQALEEMAPEYAEAYKQAIDVGEQHFFNYNMLIAKRDIFDDYCDFIFRVLGRVEQITKPKGEERADRFAGYMGENLTTIYFYRNRHRFKIIYTGKEWLT